MLMEFTYKVYGITSFQIILAIITCLIITLLSSHAFYSFIQIFSSIGLIITGYDICYNKSKRVCVPKNYILLFLFTIFEALLISSPDATIKAIIETFILTTGIYLFLAGYSMKTKLDFTNLSVILYILIVILIILNLLGYKSSIISIIAVCYYILYDTQTILGNGARKYVLDEYIMAALNNYLDFIILFSKLLNLLIASKL